MTRHELNMLEFDDWYKIKKPVLPISFENFLSENYKIKRDNIYESNTGEIYLLEEIHQHYREVYWDL